jgi:hypothetical protein
MVLFANGGLLYLRGKHPTMREKHGHSGFGFSRRENSFIEMTRKMMHMCENYGNWFIYIRTTFNSVVFVESQRGN